MERIATPSKTKEIVNKYGFRFRKSLGQNFLVEPKFIDKIVDAAGLNEDEIVVEIGPGIGALTQSMAGQAGQVVAVEIDQKLIPILQEILAPYQNIKVVNHDALKVDFNAITNDLPDRGKFKPEYKIVANLPYYITTPVIMRVLEGDFNFSSMVLMVQKEVAERMMASPGTKDYGALSIGVQYHCEPQIVTIVPKTVFMPRPEVESAVIKLVKRTEPIVNLIDERLFFTLVKSAFGQRRKTLLNSLNNSGIARSKEEWQEALNACDIDPQRRGETLSIQEFAKLSNYLSESGKE